MDRRILDLNFAQLSKSWAKSKFNNYADQKKQEHIKQLSELYEKLKQEDFSQLDIDDITQRSYIIDFFFKNLEFLENSTLNLIPFEIVECLRYALHDWLDAPDSYIIVTSLVNNLMSYSFDPMLAIDFYYPIVKTVYGLEFTHRLIQINIPRFLVRDYLASVALYHELGHFVDNFHEITFRIAGHMAAGLNNQTVINDDLADVLKFFPFIQQPTGSYEYITQNNFARFKSHIAEYFCDIFASQYIDNSLNDYLLYITKNQDKPGPNHPATTHRVEMSNSFLSGNHDSYVLKTIINATQIITNRSISTKYTKFKEDDLINLLPADISEPSQLHYLFTTGWKIWKTDFPNISTQNNIVTPLEDEKVYDVVNNLIEKSIGNYIVHTSWKKATK
ncbi:hypothetical protein KLP40_07305 [Hymenobacter sp. NST-14]|uniref:hypothetical protein n=1 Tax=Hymenobacter piscis TaxID=2839984 RepID=UPI001C02AA53|nr:hypothetical protein [Hymenobacter piscis]MBT9392964.1 hypothetical protein [Hymenobacter piscis]